MSIDRINCHLIAEIKKKVLICTYTLGPNIQDIHEHINNIPMYIGFKKYTNVYKSLKNTCCLDFLFLFCFCFVLKKKKRRQQQTFWLSDCTPVPYPHHPRKWNGRSLIGLPAVFLRIYILWVHLFSTLAFDAREGLRPGGCDLAFFCQWHELY